MNYILISSFDSSHFFILHQSYQSSLFQHIYKTILKKYKYKTNNKVFFNKISEIYYAELNIENDKKFDTSNDIKKVFINFLNIKLVCNRY